MKAKGVVFMPHSAEERKSFLSEKSFSLLTADISR